MLGGFKHACEGGAGARWLVGEEERECKEAESAGFGENAGDMHLGEGDDLFMPRVSASIPPKIAREERRHRDFFRGVRTGARQFSCCFFCHIFVGSGGTLGTL